MVEEAIVVAGSGVVEVEFQANSLLKRICKDLDKYKLSGVQNGIANSAQPGMLSLFYPHHLPKLLIKSFIHRIATVVEKAVMVVGFGVVEVVIFVVLG